MMMYYSRGTCKWDSCAGEAIIKGLKGIMITPCGEHLEYDADNKDYVNRKGFFATFNEDLATKLQEFYKKNNK